MSYSSVFDTLEKNKYPSDMTASQQIDALANEVESTILQMERLQGKASVEGVGTLATRAATSLADFIIKVVNNTRHIITGLFKDVRRSELQAFLQSKPLNVQRLYQADYSKIYKAQVPYFPYNQGPLTVSAFTNETFESLNMYSRFISILEGYLKLASSIRAKDEDEALASIKRLDELNEAPLVKSLQDQLKKLVITRIPSKYGTFGLWFSSMTEVQPVVKSTLNSARIFDEALSVSKKLDKLYKGMDELHDSLEYLVGSEFNISKLKGVTDTIRNTGHLLEMIGVTVKEQSHLEHWLVESLSAGIKNNK